MNASETKAPEQGLAKTDTKTPAVITTPDEYRQSLTRWQAAHYHVLSPAITFSGLPPQHGMVAAMVQSLDEADPAEVEAYTREALSVLALDNA